MATNAFSAVPAAARSVNKTRPASTRGVLDGYFAKLNDVKIPPPIHSANHQLLTHHPRPEIADGAIAMRIINAAAVPKKAT